MSDEADHERAPGRDPHQQPEADKARKPKVDGQEMAAQMGTSLGCAGLSVLGGLILGGAQLLDAHSKGGILRGDLPAAVHTALMLPLLLLALKVAFKLLHLARQTAPTEQERANGCTSLFTDLGLVVLLSYLYTTIPSWVR